MSRYPDPKDWVVSRHRHHRLRIVIQHTDGSPVSVWIARLRSHLKKSQQRSPSDLLEEVRRSESLDLGIMPGREAHRIAQVLQQQGFDVLVENASYVSYFPMVAGGGLIIEDDAEAEAFCLKLIQEGATVQEIED